MSFEMRPERRFAVVSEPLGNWVSVISFTQS